MKLSFEHGWDIGRRRESNEDSYLTWQAGSAGEINGEPFLAQDHRSSRGAADPPVGLFLVADGVGGAAAGEVASKLAVETVALEVEEALASSQAVRGSEHEWGAVIKEAVEQANRQVRAARQHAGNDMGTTLVGALIVGSTACVVNVGDSRAYLINREGYRRITRDHSLVQSLVDSGQIREEDVRRHPQRNIILRSLGDQTNVEVDLFPTPLEPNQDLLLCSDGLWELVQDDDLQRIIRTKPDLKQAASALVDLANENGGTDNISVIIVRYLDDQQESRLDTRHPIM